MTPETLAYIIGGYSYSQYKTKLTGLGSFKQNYDGFHVGGGLEAMISPNATVRVEYRYTEYSGEDWGTGGAVDVAPSTHTGTVGVAWNFGGGGSSTAQAAGYVAPAGSDWTGFYIGADVGGGAVVDELKFGPVDFNGIGGEGALGGLMAGYNHQMNNIVLGLQGEVGYDDLRTKATAPGFKLDAQQGLVASLSARAGLLVTPETLAYIIGGYSYSEYKTKINAGGSTAFKQNYDGFHIGGGLEAMISPNATVRVEYRYTQYSGEDWGTGGAVDVAPSTHTGTVGVAWTF